MKNQRDFIPVSLIYKYMKKTPQIIWIIRRKLVSLRRKLNKTKLNYGNKGL